ncbi:ATP-dependent DNA helicase Irc3 [Schizosaccharomyces japonicus yFS275]|uniref:ATP-dependent DNA helicase Irc3 n=1 Tax=Schizosaccharomyces japonicus (strain yFS275 / FY16936) TaxID=402676 RepID=B6K5T8_SCHJY|nr:ATP-dependent DNA helicase Irc3 [Schizosaccharomyces japonicus yFS275]EEB08892.2 ATP-dependent DNA helicase Irc3 [Schizosaccharomyces japonicus yFS275]
MPIAQFRQIRFNSTFHLRPYQEECIQSVLQSFAQGTRRVAISLATGSGKTVVFSHLIDRVQPIRPNANQCLILLHRKELAQQAFRHCRALYPEKTIEIEMGDKHASGMADITIASVLSLKNERLQKFDPDKFKLILIDEAHHSASMSYTRVLNHFQAISSASPVYVVGVTATLFRADGKGLFVGFDDIVYHRHFIDMIKENWLVDTKVIRVSWSVDHKLAASHNHEDEKLFALQATNQVAINEIPRAWMEHAQGTRSSTLVFCVNIEHAYKVSNAFRNFGIDARMVSGRTPAELRHTTIQDFRDKRFPVLVNCSILNEGTDIPNIDCIIIARPVRSTALLVQMIGRGLRLSEGKEDCLILDMCNAFGHTRLDTAPTLTGLGPPLSEDEMQKYGTALAETLNMPPGEQGMFSRLRFSQMRALLEIIGDMKKNDDDIYRISRLAWVAVGMQRYVLQTLKGAIVIDKDMKNETFNGSFRVLKQFKNAFVTKKSALFTDIPTLEAAVRASETYLKSQKSPLQFCMRHATWRQKPASNSQLNFLKKLKLWDGKKPLTAGAAANHITATIYGKKARSARQQKLLDYTCPTKTNGRIAQLKEIKNLDARQ